VGAGVLGAGGIGCIVAFRGANVVFVATICVDYAGLLAATFSQWRLEPVQVT